ncbi:MAG: amino acid ABC transporter substrate-binding protein [Termitinemataceae bacterium]|nr:MAG: amino acid ABC transporter substrate-binding protein [Termitinemataceae bacterium]
MKLLDVPYNYYGGIMKKLFVFTLAVLSATGLFAQKNDNSLQKVLDAKKFVLGLDDSFPPMGFRDAKTNEIVGFDIDLAKEVTKRMGIQFVAQPIDWNSKEQELGTGQIDCIWNGFTITKARAKAILYSPPYLKNAQVIVVKNDSNIKTLADLKGKKIGTQMGSSSVDAIDANKNFKKSVKQVVEYKDFLSAFMDLDAGGVDAVVADLIVANDSIGRSGKPLRKLSETLSQEEFGIGFRKNDKALQEKVWSTLLEMAKDGTVASISKKWFGEDITVIGK